jgi:hypothetical protein
MYDKSIGRGFGAGNERPRQGAVPHRTRVFRFQDLFVAQSDHRIDAHRAPRRKITRHQRHDHQQHGKSRQNTEIHSNHAKNQAGHRHADGKRNRQPNRQADPGEFQGLAGSTPPSFMGA